MTPASNTICFHVSINLVYVIRRPLVGHQAVKLLVQSKWFEGLDLVGVLATLDGSITTHLVVTWIWGPPGNPFKSMKFQACSQYPQISLKVCPRSPKVTKMTPKTLPGDTKFVNKWKTWNISKTVVFIAFITHTATGFQQHFYLWIIKTMDLETVSHFGTQIIDKSQKGLQNVSQEPPQLDPKIYKNGLLDPNVSIGRPSGSLDHQSCPQGT